ncbi:MAG TPA: L,D-transpeptidase family protein [Pseudolabrys sp.]|nr:L,D-transpeptidase family protein [Pseudolabrys sp.]
MNRRPLVRTLLASAAIAAAIALSGCDQESTTAMMPGRAMAPLSEKMLASLQEKNMDKDSPILVRIFKSEAELEVWKQDRNGEFALLKTYPICRWSGDLGPKVKEGDRQAPEGFYNITPGQMNPNSSYYLAFNIGYPNAYDRAWGRTGSELMVHGDCSSRGCYAMTDEQISEIYSLARESFFGGQKSFQVQAYPFHMTPENLARHRNSPHLAFWKMLKRGYDEFEISHQQPKVDVCERHYVFDAVAPANSTKPLSFNPTGKCPAYELPADIRDLVATRERQDETKFAELVARGTPVAASRAGIDGGMNPVFYARLDNRTTTNDSDVRGFLTPQPTATASLGKNVNPPATVADTDVSAPAAAPTQVAGRAAKPTGIASLLNGMFQPPPQETQTSDDVGLRGSETTDTKAKAKPASPVRLAAPAHAKPQHELASAPGAAKPVELPPEPKAVAASAPAAAAAPAPTREAVATPQLRSAFNNSTQTNGSALLAGAQPTVPVGSFNSRWSGLQ